MTSPSTLEVLVADLLRRPGSRRRFRASVALGGLAISTASVPEDGLVDVDVELESMSNAMVATGTVTAPWVGQCRRCLGRVEASVEVEVREIFEPSPTDGETYQLGSESVDLEPMVRDVVILALPLAPLCGPNCAGPAPDEFPTGPVEEGEAPQGRDPRWAALDEISFED